MYRVVHKYMCNKKFKYLRQMSTKRAEIFTSNRGLLKVFFVYCKVSKYTWKAIPLGDNMKTNILLKIEDNQLFAAILFL